MQKTTLTSLYAKHKGKLSDKWPIYLSTYDRLLKEYQSQAVNLLEIGIQNGGSLEIWSKYFDQAINIVGCDINEKCKLLQFTDSRISVVVGDANSEKTQRAISKISTGFDMIIDDGSHKSSDIVKSFARYFPKLNLGGIFIAEDLHCSYWEAYEGGLFDRHSSISFFKRLADIINHEHWGIQKSRKWLMQGFETTYGVRLKEDLLSQVHSIEFINSLCVIRKSTAADNKLGKRVIVGSQDLVEVGLRTRNGSDAITMDQSSNPWANRTELPEDELLSRIQQSQQLSDQLAALQPLLDQRDKLLQQQLELIAAQNEFVASQKVQLETEKLKNTKSHYAHQDKLAVLEHTLNETRAVLAERDHRLSELHASTSWRLTRPVRFLGHQVKRARFVTKALPRVLATNGGIKKSASKALRALKTQGIGGLRQAWRRANRIGHSSEPLELLSDGTVVGINDYGQWLKRYGTIDFAMREAILDRIAAMQSKPKISIIMPVYNPNIQWLRDAIESVRGQFYENWQLCLADDCSTDSAVRSLLERYAKLDDRISVVYRPKNGHIAEASNSAIELATGDWFTLMDQDDLLPPEALYCVAKVITEQPSAAIIYSDEDKIDERGNRYNPYFKPDWNPDLFLSQNMINHLGTYRAELVRQVGGFRSEFVGAQDYDLALRIIEQIKPDQIIHIPRVLYHWRSHSDSTAQSGSNKNYALIAGEKALNDHFARMKIDAEAKLLDIGMYRAVYKLPSNSPLVSLIIPTRNAYELVKQCVSSILEKTTYRNFEIIIIDNNSDDPIALDYFKQLNEHPQITVVRDERPFNYSALNNSAVEIAKGEYIGLINNDIEVISPDWLNEMMSLAAQPGVGAVGARLWYPDDTLQHGGVVIGVGGVAGHAHSRLPRGEAGYFGRAALTQTLTAVTAACLIVSKKIYNEVGGLNERDLTVAFNDVDFCLKVHMAGYRNIWTPFAELYHHESATRGFDNTPAKKKRFAAEVKFMMDEWQTETWPDPAYSPNLSDKRYDYSLAWPPRATSQWLF